MRNRSPEFLAFYNAKQRCTNKNHPRYKDWGGRGIKFLLSSYKDIINAIGQRPEGYVLDRINNDGNYEIGNIRWVSKELSTLNTRIRKDNKSGLRGLSYDISTGCFRLRIFRNKKLVFQYNTFNLFEACCQQRRYSND